MTVSTSEIGTSGMVLCAGLGTRMRPLTLTKPKPLIEVAGKPLIAHAIDQLENNGTCKIVVNTHYLAEQVESWVNKRPDTDILISDEADQLLETGGGVLKAKEMLGTAPFFVLNSDAFWIDRPNVSTLNKMQQSFKSANCDFLLLLAKHDAAVGFDGNGDFFQQENGRLKRRGDADYAPYIFAGCYLVHPRVLIDCPIGPFSMNLLWNRALEKGRVRGLVHDGLWLHVGTPEAIKEAEQAIELFQSDL